MASHFLEKFSVEPVASRSPRIHTGAGINVIFSALFYTPVVCHPFSVFLKFCVYLLLRIW